jgi:ABC-type nitrate/sulfonate/bicarbonate transport system substrate-binding protein
MRPWVDENIQAAQAFRRSIIKAAEFANTHPRETRSIIDHYVPLEPVILNTVVLPQFITGSLNEALLEEMIVRMRQADWLKSSFTSGDLLWNGSKTKI